MRFKVDINNPFPIPMNDVDDTNLENLVRDTRDVLRGILIVSGRPVKGTTKEQCYEALEMLQDLYMTNRGITTDYFLELLNSAKKKPTRETKKQLKQQLVEKDEEIAKLKESLKQAFGFLQCKADTQSMWENWYKDMKGDGGDAD